MGARPIHVTWTGEHRFDVGVTSGPVIQLDGSGKTGPSPVDAVLCALASCAAVDVVDILAKRRTPVSSLTVTVNSERAESVPRRITHVAMHFTIAGAGLERVHVERAVELGVMKYCSVKESLREDIGIEWTIDLHAT